jgi:hypothetical protein
VWSCVVVCGRVCGRVWYVHSSKIEPKGKSSESGRDGASGKDKAGLTL